MTAFIPMTPEQQIARIQEVRNFISKQGSKFVSVNFVKKDGSDRQMTFNPKGVAKHAKGSKASASAQQAVATRKQNNPHLFNIYEHNLKTGETDTTKMRCFNMLKINKIRAGGETLEFV